MNGDTICKSGETRAGFQRAADYGGISCCDAQRLHILAAENTQILRGSRQRQPQPIENGLLAQRDDFRRDVFVLEFQDKFRDIAGQAGYLGKLILCGLRRVVLSHRTFRWSRYHRGRSYSDGSSEKLTSFHFASSTCGAGYGTTETEILLLHPEE